VLTLLLLRAFGDAMPWYQVGLEARNARRERARLAGAGNGDGTALGFVRASAFLCLKYDKVTRGHLHHASGG
jgi:hypothetical protein